MLNMLVIEDDPYQLQNIINLVSKELNNVRLYSMVSCGNDAIKIISEQQVDIILLDLQLPDISGIDILNFIASKNINKYTQSIIVISANAEAFKLLRGNIYVYNCISKPFSPNVLIRDINKIIEHKNFNSHHNNIKNLITFELESLQYNFTHNGTKYISDIIFELYLQQNNYCDNLKETIYPIIAKRYGKTVDNIKSSIFQATKMMYYNCEENFLMRYFHFYSPSKPKSKEVIFTILNKIMMYEKNIS